MKYKYIIWDWNGTLLNDVGAALDSVNDMLKARNMPPMDIVRYKEIIGVPIRKFYEKCFDLEKEDYNEILKQWNEGYLRHLPEHNLTEGVTEMLEYFKKEGCTQLIVSSSNKEQLIANVSKYNIADYFDAILGADGYLAESKVQRAINYLQSKEKENALVIGDLEHDAQMAEEIGADCILLSTGHEKLERLKNSGYPVIDKITEIKNFI